MTKLFTIVLIFLLMFSCTDKVPDENKDGYKNGKEILYYENGQISSQENYKDGKPYGKWIWYYENGRIRMEGNYKDGKPFGEWTYYNDEGKIVEYGNWKNDIEYVKGYYDNGGIKYEGEKDWNKRQLGLWTWYHENGRIRNQGYWNLCMKNDTMFVKVDTWKRYDKNGKLIKKEIYSNCNDEKCPCPSDIYGNLIEVIEY